MLQKITITLPRKWARFWENQPGGQLPPLSSVADLGGTIRLRSPHPPLGDRLTPSITLLLMSQRHCIMATPSPVYLQTRKTLYSEYSKWLPLVAFWQLSSAPNSFSARVRFGPRSLRLLSWFKKPTSKGRREKGEGKGPAPLRKFLNPPLPQRSLNRQLQVGPRNWHTFFVRLNLIKYWSIFKLISFSESGEHV